MDFNSHAHVERDLFSTLDLLHICDFNSHAHVERDRRCICMMNEFYAFQLTRSRGAWLVAVSISNIPSIFQLTRSRGAWRYEFSENSWRFNISTHTLTWSVTAVLQLVRITKKHFNSHAHVERDAFVHFNKTFHKISTHTLTWSVTMCGTNFGSGAKISTHTLTWSVTYPMGSLTALYTFQLTRSRGAWPCRTFHFFSIDYFNSHAHVERDELPHSHI